MTRLEDVLAYLELGLPIFPVQCYRLPGKERDEKKPLVDWKVFQERLPTEAEVRNWWKMYPTAGVGMATGKLSGFIVVDTELGADLKKYKLEGLNTPTVKTGGGGKHFYFKYEPSRNAVKFYELHDFRGDGGYVVIPPTVQSNGTAYEWVVPLLADPLPLPDDIRKSLKEKSSPERTSTDWNKILSETRGEGSRNDTAASVAGKLLLRFPEHEWEDQARPLLLSWNREMNDPPLPENEVLAVFRSISASERRRKAAGEAVGEPTVARGGHEYVVSVPIQDGMAVFSFIDPLYSKGDLEAGVRCYVEIPGGIQRAFESRLNVLSGSSKEAYARQLTQAFGKTIPWVLVLSQASAAFAEAYRQSVVEERLYVEEIQHEPTSHLLYPFIEEKSVNIIFGSGSSGKTYLTIRMAMAMASGVPFLGCVPTKKVKTLFLDYEGRAGTFKERIEKMAPAVVGYSRDANKNLCYLHARGTPLFDLKNTLRDIIRRDRIELLIIDSAALACGGPPEDAMTTNKFFNALHSIDVTTLIIGHVAKGDEQQATVFGSVFFMNGARNAWNVQKDQEGGENETHVGLFHRKANNDKLHTPYAARINFGEFVTIESESPGRWGKEMGGTKTRILKLLSEGNKTAKELSDTLVDLNIGTIKTSLSRLAGEEAIVSLDKGKWGLR